MTIKIVKEDVQTMADALTEVFLYGGIPSVIAFILDMVGNGGNGTAALIEKTGNSVPKVIQSTKDTLAKIRAALDRGVSYKVQRELRITEYENKGVPHDLAVRVVDKMHGLFLPSKISALVADVANAEIGSLNDVGQRSARANLPMLTNLLDRLEYYQRVQGLTDADSFLLEGNMTLLLGSNSTMSPARLPTMTPWTLGQKTAEALLNKYPAMSTDEPLKLENKYAHALPESVHQMLENTGTWAYNLTSDLGALIGDLPGYVRWMLTFGVAIGAATATTYYFYSKYRETKKTDDNQQKTVELMRELYKVKTEAEKAVLEMVKETHKVMTETRKQTISREQRKSPRISIKPLDDSDEEEEVKRPSTKSQEFIIKPFEESDDEKMIPLLVDAFVTLAVSRALLFEIPQDPPQSIWAYAKSFVVNVVEPSFLVKMVCMEFEDADKLNPISRSFWPYYEKEWSKEERRRYKPLLNLKGLHVSAALKVKAVLDNSDHYDPKSLLGYIAKHRDQIKSGGLYQTLARFPLLLLEYFGDNLKTLESDIRERDQDIQRQDPIPDKPGIDEKVWKDPTIDLLFLFDASQMDANRIGNMLDWGTPLIREEMYWLSKHPRVLQDHLFRARLKHGIQSRVEVKTRDTTVVVFKPWISNESIWQVMENQASMMIKNERHTILHLRAAFLLAAADLENQIMEEHFDWKEGPFKRMMQHRHEAKWRGNSLGAPMIMPRSTMQAPWFADVSWFSSLVTCSSTRDMVQTMLKNPKNFPMFSDMTDGKEGDKIHALLNKRPVTVTFAKNSVAQQTHDVMQRMGQYSFARETGLDCFVYGQFGLNGFAALAHYGQSKALHAYKEYATDAALCKVILSMGEAHRYGYLLNLKQESLRIDPGTKSVFVELFRASKDTSPDFQKLCSFDFQKLLSLWAAINPKTELANVLKTRSDVLESIKGCTLSSPYETREGLMKMGPWLHALKNMHDENLYGFITPKLLQLGTYYGNKSAEIAPNIDHRGLVDTNKWSKKLDCRMLLKSMMLLSKYIEYGTWDANLPVWQDDIPTCGLNDEIEITIEMLIESRHQSLLFLDDLLYLQWYTQTTPKRESLFSYRFRKGDKIWKYDIKKQRLYEEIGKTLVNEMSIAKIRAATATKP